MLQELFHTFVHLSYFQLCVLVLFGCIWLLRCIYLFLVTGKIAFLRKSNSVNNSRYPLSLLFAFRNQEDQIKRLFPGLLNLKNDNFEVIAVDDYSQDNGFSVLGLYKQKYPHLKLSSLNQETRFSEKLSQNIALKSAGYEWVMSAPLTMKDTSNEWLSSFQKAQGSQFNLLCGYSNASTKKGWYNRLYRVESMFQYLKSVGFIYNRAGFIYEQNNVAFRKEEYFRKGGFGPFIREPYANLELVINSFITKKKTRIVFNADSKMVNDLETNRLVFLNLLKKSWRIEAHLPSWKRAVLLFDSVTQLLFLPITAVAFLLVFPVWPVLTALLGLMLGARVLIIKITINRLNERKIFITSLVYGLLMPFYKLIMRWYFFKTSRKQKWRSKV